MQRSFSLAEVLVVVFLLLILVSVFMPAIGRGRPKANKTKCANNLRQLSFAVIQYSDDKRFTPHVRGFKELDGDEASNHTPQTVRALVWYGYHDNPEGFICPSSSDLHMPLPSGHLDDMRLWVWGGQPLTPDQVTSGAFPWGESGRDPTLLDTTELSFAYTRKAYTRNVASKTLLASDRGVRYDDLSPEVVPIPGNEGNHTDGWNVVRFDASAEWIDAETQIEDTHPYEFLSGEEKGALPISSVARPVD